MTKRTASAPGHLLPTLQFRVEIETTGLSSWRLARAIKRVTGGKRSQSGSVWWVSDAQDRVWQVIGQGPSGGTIVSPALGPDDTTLLRDIMDASREAGALTGVNGGINVRIEGTTLSATGLTSLLGAVYGTIG